MTDNKGLDSGGNVVIQQSANTGRRDLTCSYERAGFKPLSTQFDKGVH